MKFRLSRADLMGALDIVSLVQPGPIVPQGQQGGAGYLFVVRNDRCFIYSGGNGGKQVSRVDIAVGDCEDVPEDGGKFIFPADKIGSMAYHRGESIMFEAGYDEEDNRYWVRYQTELGAAASWDTQNPGLVMPFDDALDAAEETEKTYPPALLQEAIGMVKPYLVKPTDSRAPKYLQSLQLFDASKPEWDKGDGVMFAADQIRACWVESETFKGKSLNIHGQHIPIIASFLSKCEGDVHVRQGASKTYALSKHDDDGGLRVLGWSHQVEIHTEFRKYPELLDTHILRAQKEHVVSALRSTRAALDKRQDKIRVVYKTATEQTGKPGLMFLLSEGCGRAASELVDVEPIMIDKAGAKGASQDFANNVNIDHLLGLVEPLRSHEFNLRFAIVPKTEKRREHRFFRTIDLFWIDDKGKIVVPGESEKASAYQCKVTRFTPVKD